MAPFKLFRIAGSTSRSTSQENEPDQHISTTTTTTTTTNINKLTTAITSSAYNNYNNIDESDQTSENSSIMSLNNDQRALLSAADQIGYSSPQLSEIPPTSPPPTYDSVMKENQLLALDKENNTIHTTIHTNLLVESFYTTPNSSSNNNLYSEMNEYNTNCNNNSSDNANNIHQQNMASPSRENLLIDNSQCIGLCNCNRDSCNQLCTMNSDDVHGNNNETCDEYNERCLQNDRPDERCNLDENSTENYNNCSEEYSSECQNQYHHNRQDNEYSNQYYNDGSHQQQMTMNYSDSATTAPAKGPELIYKSTKELYKAVARECGITCKMTDTCRCVECQSRYFDCEFDQNDNDTRQDHSDGGLGAGTPMFVNEVLHGTACTIL